MKSNESNLPKTEKAILLTNFRLSPKMALLVFIGILLVINVFTELFGSNYTSTLFQIILINAMLAVSLTAANGFTGLFSLGHPAFMTIGAYTAIILTYPVNRRGFAMPDLPDFLVDFSLPLLGAVLIAMCVAGIVAVLIGLVVLKLKTHYLAVASLGLIVVVQNLALNLDGITRGGRGLTGIPRDATLPFISVVLLVMVIVCWKIKHSSLGRAMLAVRENELAARSYGIHAFRLKLLSFTLGALGAGAGGALIPHVIAVMSPQSFGIVMAFNLIAIIVVGGQGSIIGALIVSFAIAGLTEFMRPLEEAYSLFGITQVIIALLLVVVLIVRPQGIFDLGEPWVKNDEH